MEVANTIRTIYNAKQKINSMPKYRFLSRYKQNKILEKEYHKFMDYDIFRLTDIFLSFVLAVDEGYLKDENYIKFKNGYLIISLTDSTVIEYFAKSNKFQVTEDNIAYTVYRNTKCGKYISTRWEIIQNILKTMYYPIISKTIDKICT